LPDKSHDALKTVFGNLPPNIIARNVGIANNHTLPQLIQIISILREYDVKSKGVDANNDEGELLKEMIYKITHV